jgi:DHA2 family methylenomycin A resistance protein-like MFS transporter
MALVTSLGALRERQFRLLWAGQTFSNLGSALVPIALAFAVLDLTGSATDLGLVLLASRLPQVLLVVAGGLVGLRWRPRRPLLAAVLVVLALAPLVAGLAVAAPLWVLALAGLGGGLQASLHEVLWSTSLQQHVPPEALSRVSAYGWLGALLFAPLATPWPARWPLGSASPPPCGWARPGSWPAPAWSWPSQASAGCDASTCRARREPPSAPSCPGSSVSRTSGCWRAGMRGGSRRALLVVMCAGYFLVLLDVTIVNVALPSIGAGLGADVGALQWVVDGYAIALASLMLAGGTVGDLHGHKRIVLVGLAVFGVASLACGAAPSSGLLIGARVLQGIGAALLLPGTLAIISHAFPEPDEQAKAIGIWAGIGGLALPAGPLLGGALIDAFGWRAIFLVNVPIVLVTLPVAVRVVRESAEPQQRRLDLAGTALAAGALAAVTFAFVAGRGGVGPPVLAAAAAAVVCLAGFVAVERSREHPMFPLALFRRPDFSAANAAAGAMNLGTLGMLFVLTLYLQTVQHRSALAAGVAVLPLFLPLTVLAPLAGRLTARVGPKLPMAAGLVIAALGVGLLARAHAGSGYRALLPALLLWGIGMGVLTPAVVAAAVRTVPARRAGLASAVNNTAARPAERSGSPPSGPSPGAPLRPRPSSPGCTSTRS